MAGIADFIFGKGALKAAGGETEEERRRRLAREQAANQNNGSTPVPVNASDAAAIAQAKLKQEAIKKVVKTRSKGGSYK